LLSSRRTPCINPIRSNRGEARKAKYQGVVLVGLTVEPSGEMSNLCVEQALGDGLDEKAIATVKTWRFEPATKDSQPVPDRVPKK